jgi:hypothetical protein
MSARFFAGLGAMATATGLLSACSTFSPRSLVIPQQVSVGDALEELGCGFRRMRAAQAGTKVGAIPAEMKVNLKVTVSAKDGGKLSVAPSASGITASAEKSSESSASRENTIEVTFKSLPLYVLDKTMTDHGKGFKAGDIKALLDMAQDEAPFFHAPVAAGPRDGGVGNGSTSRASEAPDPCAKYFPAPPPPER